MTHNVFSSILISQTPALLLQCVYCNYEHWMLHTEVCMIC